MFRMTLLAALLSLFAGCATVDHQAEAIAMTDKTDNANLGIEAAAFRKAVRDQR